MSPCVTRFSPHAYTLSRPTCRQVAILRAAPEQADDALTRRTAELTAARTEAAQVRAAADAAVAEVSRCQAEADAAKAEATEVKVEPLRRHLDDVMRIPASCACWHAIV